MTDRYIPWWVPNDHPARSDAPAEPSMSAEDSETIARLEAINESAHQPLPEEPAVEEETG